MLSFFVSRGFCKLWSPRHFLQKIEVPNPHSWMHLVPMVKRGGLQPNCFGNGSRVFERLKLFRDVDFPTVFFFTVKENCKLNKHLRKMSLVPLELAILSRKN